MSTKIPGPYTDVDRDDKITVQGGIPETIYERTFQSRFTQRGAQDRIITSLFSMFVQLCDDAGIPQHFHEDNELKAIKVIQQMNKQTNT